MNVLNLFKTYKVEDVTGEKTGISNDMYNRIELLTSMMNGNAPWNKEAKPCGIIPQIAGRLNMFVTREIGLDVRNEAIKRPMEHLNHNIDKVVEYITLLGSGLIRPIYVNNKLQYEIIPLGNYLPTQYDFDGTLTGAIIIKQIDDTKKTFLLVETHHFDGITHKVNSSLYQNIDGKLKHVSLSACEQTSQITPEYQWTNCNRPMIVEFRNHATNKIDGSNVPVALINEAIDLIEKADKQFERMDWEQEAGEKRIFADRDMFSKRTSRNGDVDSVIMSKSLNRLITKIDGDGTGNGEKIHEYSPELRTTAQNEYLQQIFRRIELTLNVGKGSISDTEAVTQTATQYSGGRQELFAIVDKIEDEIASKYKDIAEVFSYMAQAYGLKGSARTEEELFIIKWNDDQTRKDIHQAKQTALQEIGAGVLNKWEYRKTFFGEDEETAKANIPTEEVSQSPFSLM